MLYVVCCVLYVLYGMCCMLYVVLHLHCHLGHGDCALPGRVAADEPTGVDEDAALDAALIRQDFVSQPAPVGGQLFARVEAVRAHGYCLYAVRAAAIGVQRVQYILEAPFLLQFEQMVFPRTGLGEHDDLPIRTEGFRII
jgi:hypothetical protein